MNAWPKRLIVNADDFGLSEAVDRGIVRAHREGVLTSASLMVDRAASTSAAALARAHPRLSLGLHLELDADGPERVAAQIERQAERFRELAHTEPTHVDSHHDVHRAPGILPHVLAWSVRWGVPLRGHCGVTHVGRFYGRWGGESHPEQIGVEGFLRIVDRWVGSGTTELSCHPGELDPRLVSSYTVERPIELGTLCDPRVREGLHARGIRLVGFRDVPLSLAGT